MQITGRLKLTALLSTLFLTSCSTFTQPESIPTNTPWANRATKLAAVQRFDINGKIAVRTSRDSGSATIHWVQAKQNYTISILGPLGANGMTLTGQPGSVSMETSDGKHVHSNSAEDLLAKQWGYNLPVSYLQYWVRGMPVPNLPANEQFDQYHRLTSITQQGWHVEFLSYTSQGGVDLPQRMNISSNTLSAKMFIYTWAVS